MGLDAALVNQPAEHLGGSVGGVTGEALRVEIEALFATLDHPLGGRDLGLTHGGRGLDINNHGVIEIDQVVGRP